MNATIMGIVNITPDSFSDGGDCWQPDLAIGKIKSMLDRGIDAIDIGAESTRPGAKSIDTNEEWRRLEPVLRCLRQDANKLSIDTRNPVTALRVSEEFGVGWINNVSGLFAQDVMSRLARISHLRFIAMHMHGEPQTMQLQPLSARGALSKVTETFEHFAESREKFGWESSRFYFDPGIGFGKDDAANWSILGATATLAEKYQLCLGVSRKSLLGRLLQIEAPKLRDQASKVLEVMLILAGAAVIRTHHVDPLLHFRTLMAEARLV